MTRAATTDQESPENITAALRGAALIAQKTVVLLTDDLDGGTADETVTFALDGVQYPVEAEVEEFLGRARPDPCAGRPRGRVARSPERSLVLTAVWGSL